MWKIIVTFIIGTLHSSLISVNKNTLINNNLLIEKKNSEIQVQLAIPIPYKL